MSSHSCGRDAPYWRRADGRSAYGMTRRRAGRPEEGRRPEIRWCVRRGTTAQRPRSWNGPRHYPWKRHAARTGRSVARYNVHTRARSIGAVSRWSLGAARFDGGAGPWRLTRARWLATTAMLASPVTGKEVDAKGRGGATWGLGRLAMDRDDDKAGGRPKPTCIQRSRS